MTVYANGKVRTLGDYDVTYRRNGVVTNDVESVGTVSVSVTGKGNYTGTVNAGTFTISPLSVNDRSVAVTLNPTSYTYDGTAKTPSVIVRINGVTVGSDNYTVTYLDNKNVGVGRVRIDCNGNLTGSRETTFAIRQQTTPTTPDTKPADTTPTQTTTPTTSTYDPYYDNLYYYLLMRRAMRQQYWNGYGNYWDPYTYYRQQMLMRLWMSYMLRPYSWYGYAPSQAYQPYYANSYYGQPRVWNSRYNNYALDYSYNGYNPYTYRNYGYRAPYMDVYPVTVRRSNNYYAPIRTVSPFNVDSDLYKVSYEKVSGEYGIDVDPRTGELSVNPYVQPGMYDVGVRVSGLDRMTGRPYTDVMNANVYVR